MRKFFSALKNQTSSLVTIFALFIVGAYYFFIYIPNNEKTVQEGRFRCLQNIDNNVRAKIGGSADLIRNILATGGAGKIEDAFSAYKSKDAELGFTLLKPAEAQAEQKGSKLLGFVYLKGVKYANRIKIDAASQQLLLFVTAKGGLYKDSITIGMLFGFKEFIKPLLPPSNFDNYIVFVETTKVYESFPSGLNYDEDGQDSLLEVKNKIITPGVHDIKIGGTDYKTFSQPIYTNTGAQWVISGLVSNNNYQKEKNQLPVPVVELLLTAAIIMLVSLPWIKLYHMGNKDKLAVRDGIVSLLALMVMMSLLFFVFFKYNTTIRDKRLPRPQIANNSLFNPNKRLPDTATAPIRYSRESYSRNMLAIKVRTAFENELDSAYSLLNSIDTIKKSPIGDSVYHISQEKKPFTYRKLFRHNRYGIDASQIAWLDMNGKVLSLLTNDNKDNADIPLQTDLSDRAYFKNVSNNNNFNRTSTHKYYIDQVVSRSSNSFESIIAKRSDKPDKVAVMAFTAKSLESVTMPDGYQFAIINSSGRVLYHFMPERNLNENLKEEFSDSTKLVSCLEAKSDTTFSEKYYGKLYNIKIKPFADMPYFVVIFEDQEYRDTRDTESFVFTLSMLICLLLFLVLQFVVILFSSAKRSFSKKQLFDISWVAPKESSHHQYNLAIIANIIIIIFLIWLFQLNLFLTFVYSLLFSVTFIPIFLSAVFARRYKIANSHLYHFKMRSIYWLCGFLLIIDIAAFNTLGAQHKVNLFLFESILIGACAIVFFFGHGLLAQVRKSLGKWHKKWTYVHSYALMTTTRLIITSGIPVAFFFVYSFNYETKLDTRYRQVKFVKALTERVRFDDHVNSKPEERIKSNNVKLDDIEKRSAIYTDMLFVNSVKDTIQAKVPARYDDEDRLTAGLLSAFRFRINDIEIKNNNMNLAGIGDTISFNGMAPELGKKNAEYSSFTFFKLNPDESLKISSENISYPYPHWYSWLVLMVLIGLFYSLVYRIIKKLFAMGLPSTKAWEELDNDLIECNTLNNLLFIVGSPGSGKLIKLRQKIENGKLLGKAGEKLVLIEGDKKGNVYIADMMAIPSEKYIRNSLWEECKKNVNEKDYALVIINHFEYNIKNSSTNSAKLDFLEKLMGKENTKVIIISTVHPVSFLDSFNNTDDNDETNKIPASELERWHVLLGHYRIVIEPLMSDYKSLMCDGQPFAPGNTNALERILMSETRYTHFLKKMQPMAVSYLRGQNINDIDPTGDSLIFKLQLTSQYFYTYIWQSLTKEEKFLLYDLAEDGLVNSYDDHNLCMLMAKGLIVRVDGTLMLFNKGFRNFILTAIGTTEAKRIKDQVKDNGNWGSLKTPLNLVILGILFFLLLSQQESYSRVITYITTIGAGFSAIMRIFPALGGSNSTQKTE